MRGIILRFPQTFLNIILSPPQLLALTTGVIDCVSVIKAPQTRGNGLFFFMLKSCLQSPERLGAFLISGASGAVPEPLQLLGSCQAEAG